MELSLIDYIIGRTLSHANIPFPALIVAAYLRASDMETANKLEQVWPELIARTRIRCTSGLGVDPVEDATCNSSEEVIEFHRKCEGIALQYLRHIVNIIELMEEERLRDK